MSWEADTTTDDFYDYLYSPETHNDNVGCDGRFCQSLYADVYDPINVLILHLLPQVREFVL